MEGPMESSLVPTCPRELEVVAAEGSGRLRPEHRAHVRTCTACAEAVDVARELARLASNGADDPLPTAAFVWWKAQLAERLVARRRADGFLGAAEGIALAVLLPTTLSLAGVALHAVAEPRGALWIGLGALCGAAVLGAAVLWIWQRVES